MNDVLKIVLSLSVSGSLLILALLLGKPFLKNKLSRRWQYYIWLVVIARLLLPFAPETNLIGSVFQTIGQVSSQTGTAPISPSDDLLVPAAALPIPGGDGPNEQVTQDQTTAPPDRRQFQDKIAPLADSLWLVWLVVALVLIMRKITVYQSFIRYIRAGQTPVTHVDLLDQLSVIAQQAGVNKAVELCVNPLISSPLLIGFFRPCLVMPSTEITKSDFRFTVLHELTHFRRRDMFYKWLTQLTICLHWFNPFVYLMGRELNKLCEFACDEAVICVLGADEIRSYGKTLLDAMAAVGKYKENLASVTLSENKELLKERLGAIMKFKNQSILMRLFTAGLTLAICLGATFTGVYAAVPVQSAMPISRITDDSITAAQADEMALALTNKIWVWDWVAFFVPYMSENGVGQIVSASQSSEWAGTIDYSTMTTMTPFSQTQVDNARKTEPQKALLTGLDIDAHAVMIMQSNGQWNCIDFMLPYMTDNGIAQVENIFAGKQGGRLPATESSGAQTPRITSSQQDIPAADVVISVKNCGVTISKSADKNFKFDFDPTRFEVVSQTNGGKFTIDVKPLPGQPGSSKFDGSAISSDVRISVPDTSCNNMKITGDHAAISVFPIDADLDLTNFGGSSSVHLDENFDRTLTYSAKDASGALHLATGLKDYSLRATVKDSAFKPAEGMPQYDSGSLPYTVASGNGAAELHLEIQNSAFKIKTDAGSADEQFNNQFNSAFPNTVSNDVQANGADDKALDIMQRTGNWGYIEAYLPLMTDAGIDRVVNNYNSKHMNPSEHKKASNYYNRGQ